MSFRCCAGGTGGRPGLPGGGSKAILQQLQKYGHGSWATPLQLLQADPEKEAEEGATELADFRQKLKDIMAQLQDGKYRSLIEGDKARPALFKKFVENEGADIEAIVTALEELVERPEASQSAKDDITAVAEVLKGAQAAFTALAEWEDPEKENTPEAKTAEGQKARLEERQKIMEDIKTAFGKGESKDGDKKDDKQDDKKEAETGRAGPLYDPDDSMGAVLMADKLEEGFRNARELLQAMMLRSEEVGNARKLKASQVVVPPFNVGTRTDVLPPTGSGFGSGGSDDINLQLDLATVSDYYSGRARLYQLPADEIPDTAIEDFSRARAALNAAFRLRDKVDLPKMIEKMKALGVVEPDTDT
eukprot:Tamp_01048.p2 GENE.Tamp_01048~~Tamp_01048.p2  ORF type:complete len:361 (-),score=83.72 Tamp_01048:3352-4434(-)